MPALPTPEAPKKNKILEPFIWLSVAAVTFPIGIYLYKHGSCHISDKKEDWDLFSTYFGGILSPIIGVLSLLVSTYIAYKFNKIQQAYQEDKDSGELQQVTIGLFKEFRSEQMSKARSNAWAMKKLWYHEDTDLRERFRRFLPIAMVNENTVYAVGFAIERQHLRAINDMISFYTMLSLYAKNGKNIKDLNYFYYPWWRGFLKELITESDRITKTCIGEDQRLAVEGFEKEKYLEHLSHMSAFKSLDEICGFQTLGDFDMMCEASGLEFPEDLGPWSEQPED